MDLGQLVVALPLGMAAVAAVTAAFLYAYLGEKGKHLATHEDMKAIIEQLRQTTRATEEIRTAISESVWLRQEQWKLKRDTYLKVITAIGDLYNTQMRIHLAEKGVRSPDALTTIAELGELQKRLLADVRTARATATVVLADEATRLLDRYQTESIKRHVDSPDYYQRGLALLEETYSGLIELARHELGLPPVGGSQSGPPKA